MLGARSAGHGDLSPECFACTEHANGRVVLRDALLLGEARNGDPLDLDALQSGRVLGLQSVGEAADAPAHLRPDHLGRFLRRLYLLRELREGAVTDLRTAVVVHRGVAKRPIEPSDRRLTVAQRFELVKTTRKRVLQDVLGNVSPTDPPLEEPQELAMVLHERTREVGIEWTGDFVRRVLVGHAVSLVIRSPDASSGYFAATNPRKRNELRSTETLESDIAALARTGDSCQPVQG